MEQEAQPATLATLEPLLPPTPLPLDQEGGMGLDESLAASGSKKAAKGAGKSGKATGKVKTGKLDFKAVLIGINYRGSSSELRGCIRDAKDVKDLLMASVPGVKESAFRMLTDDEKLQPTRKNILAAFEWLLSGAKEGSSRVLFYSGHGSYRRFDVGSDENDDRDEAIVPLGSNGDFLYDDEIRVLLVHKVPKGAKLTVVFDCCNSGTTLDLRFNVKSPSSQPSESPQYRKTKGRVLYLGACADREDSYEATAEIKIQGALTYQLVRFCESHPAGFFTCQQLLEAVTSWFVTNTYPQHPQFSFGNTLDALDTPFSWTL